MDSASEKSQDLQADGSEEVLANLLIWIDKLGSVQYNMDWKEGEEGILALSQIFYEVCVNGYGDVILSKMKEQCVLNNTELEFESFLKLVNQSGNEAPYEETKSKPVVSPDKSAYTI